MRLREHCCLWHSTDCFSAVANPELIKDCYQVLHAYADCGPCHTLTILHAKMTALLTRRFVTCALLSAGLSTSSSILRCQEVLMACRTTALDLTATSGPSMMGTTPSTTSTPNCIGHSCLSILFDAHNSKAFQVMSFHQVNLVTQHVLWTLKCAVI